MGARDGPHRNQPAKNVRLQGEGEGEKGGRGKEEDTRNNDFAGQGTQRRAPEGNPKKRGDQPSRKNESIIPYRDNVQ